MLVRGDTLIYNTRSVRTMDSETALEILRQLPGVEIRENGISVFGEPVRETFVNGIKVYGDDPMAALKSLMAEEVTGIQVYDAPDSVNIYKGLIHSRKHRVLNLKTHSRILSAADAMALFSGGQDSNVLADGHHQTRYHAGATAHFFSESLLFSLHALSDNIGRTDNLPAQIQTPSPGGLVRYTELTDLSARIEKYWKGRAFGNSIRASYSFGKQYTRSSSFSKTTYFAQNGAPERILSDTASTSSVLPVHSLNLALNLNRTPLKSIQWGNTFTWGSKRNDTDHASWLNAVSAGSGVSRQTASLSTRNAQYQGVLLWQDPDGWGRFFPHLQASLRMGKTGGEGFNLDTLSSTVTRRNFTMTPSGRDRNFLLNLGIDRPVRNDEKGTTVLSFAAESYHDNRKSRQISINVPDGSLNTANSRDYTWNVHRFSSSAGLSHNRNGLELTGRFSLNWDILSGDETIPFSSEKKWSFLGISPQFMARYKQWTFSYDNSRVLPAIEQLRARVDDSHPFAPRVGNPDLRPSSSHQWKLGTSRRMGNSAALTFQSTATLWHNELVNKSIYLPDDTSLHSLGLLLDEDYIASAGSTVSTWTNVSGGFQATTEISLSKRFPKPGLTARLSWKEDVGHHPQYAGGQLEWLWEHSPAINGYFQWTPQPKVRLTFRSETAHLHASRPGDILVKGWHESLSTSGSFQLPWDLFARYAYHLNAWKFLSSQGSDTAIHQLGLSLGRSFAKGRILLSFTAHDLLNSQPGYALTSFSTYTVQRWTPSYGRYYLLNLSFRFNKTSGTQYMGILPDGRR